jgi:hypothetical protein
MASGGTYDVAYLDNLTKAVESGHASGVGLRNLVRFGLYRYWSLDLNSGRFPPRGGICGAEGPGQWRRLLKRGAHQGSYPCPYDERQRGCRGESPHRIPELARQISCFRCLKVTTVVTGDRTAFVTSRPFGAPPHLGCGTDRGRTGADARRRVAGAPWHALPGRTA